MFQSGIETGRNSFRIIARNVVTRNMLFSRKTGLQFGMPQKAELKELFNAGNVSGFSTKYHKNRSGTRV